MTRNPESLGPESLSAKSDMPPGHWIERLPGSWRPFLLLARLDRPIGTWLLLLPCWWSLALAEAASGRAPQLGYYLLFALGALVMRAAGCTINDIFDRRLDARVARTAGRPLASGALSVGEALLFLAVLLLVGLAILLLFNRTTVWLGIASLALVVPYPLMKRITYWPQLWLGLTFNWGALIGWSATTGSLSLPPLLLYLAGIFWTLGYDTIYAHQDREDDALVGIRSSALKLGTATRSWLSAFYLAAWCLAAAAGLAAGLGWLFLLLLLPAAAQLAWQVATLDIDSPANCLARFRSNRWFAWGLLAAVWLAGLSA